MLPPVKFNMLGQMQLRGNGGGSSIPAATTTNIIVNAESKDRHSSGSSSTSSKTAATPATSSSAFSLSPQAVGESSVTLQNHESSKKASSSSNGSMFVSATRSNLPFGLNSHHQINSAFSWQLENSIPSIDHPSTRSSNSNQNGCRGAGDGVAVGGLNLNVNALTVNHHLKRSSSAFSPLSTSSANFNFQQQHEVSSRNPSHHQHHKSTKNRGESEVSNKSSKIENSTKQDAETTAVSSGSEDTAESPLDFSTKTKKFKAEALPSKNFRRRSDSSSSDFGGGSEQPLTDRDTSDSPCSRLRNILSMKSPTIPEEIAGTVLNLSKESPSLTSLWCKAESPSRSNSNSSSPVLSGSGATENATAFVQSNSPRPATIPISMGAPTMVVAPLGVLASNGSSGGGSGSSSNGTSSIGLPSWGSGVYSPSLSPILNQTVPANSGALPMSFETSPSLFSHHINPGAASPAMSFAPSLSLPISSSAPTSGSKSRATRPFKAYPKDPLTFSSVGLYGLPLGTAPGTTEAVIHQQSNQAYAEFRKQMLSSSQFGKARRGGHRNSSPYTIPVDSVDGNTSDGGSMLRANDSGSASDDGNSLTNGKNRLGKTEQQMKDDAYWERRRKNNEAAKRSRDARRAKEDEIAIRAAFLEQENLKLRFEVCALKSETAKLRCMLYSS